MRGIRGAITVKDNSRSEILTASETLVREIIKRNKIIRDEIISIIFTATADLDQVYPAEAIRKIGYNNIPLMCYQEMAVKNSLERCIRVIIYINRNCTLNDIKHTYLNGARILRPDLNNL
jgi:chorismate mutase